MLTRSISKSLKLSQILVIVRRWPGEKKNESKNNNNNNNLTKKKRSKKRIIKVFQLPDGPHLIVKKFMSMRLYEEGF